MNTFQTLVIACGNPLRGDDAVGLAAARIVTSWQLPRVKVLAVHQLVPELIDEMKCVQRVLFIDAGTNAEDRAFQTCIVEPQKSRRHFGHHETSANLLALLHELEGQAPQGWLVSISAFSFYHGETLTERTQNHLQEALVWIRAFLMESSCTKSV